MPVMSSLMMLTAIPPMMEKAVILWIRAGIIILIGLKATAMAMAILMFHLHESIHSLIRKHGLIKLSGRQSYSIQRLLPAKVAFQAGIMIRNIGKAILCRLKILITALMTVMFMATGSLIIFAQRQRLRHSVNFISSGSHLPILTVIGLIPSSTWNRALPAILRRLLKNMRKVWARKIFI